MRPKRRDASAAVTALRPRTHSLRVNRSWVTSGCGILPPSGWDAKPSVTTRPMTGRSGGGERGRGPAGVLQNHDEARDVTQVRVAQVVALDLAVDGQITHAPQCRLGEEQVGVDPERGLEQAMNQDHIRTGQTTPAAHVLPDEGAVMGDELEAQAGNARAGSTLTVVVPDQAALSLPEGAEGIDQQTREDPAVRDHPIRAHREDGVSLQLLNF